MEQVNSYIHDLFQGKKAIKRADPQPGQKPYYYVNPNRKNIYSPVHDEDIMEVDSPDDPNPFIQPNDTVTSQPSGSYLEDSTLNTSTGMPADTSVGMPQNGLNGTPRRRQARVANLFDPSTYYEPEPYTMEEYNRIPTEGCMLDFNGKKADAYRNGVQEFTIPAMSGLPECQSVNDFDKVSCGPIPPGLYTVNKNNAQTISWWDNLLGEREIGAWPGGRESWGDYRMWITPRAGTNTYGRGGFSIHGGDYPGSLGCIDVTNNTSKLKSFADSCDGDISLRVKYDENSFK